jgi:hypothetical protein
MTHALPRWRLRAITAITHITASGAWVGLDISLVALTLVHAPIPTVLSECATFAAGLTIGSGAALATRRPWGGLRRHHWIEAKILIAAVVAAAGLTSVTGALDPMSVLTARVCALVALIAATAVSVTKPWGLTPHGRATRNRRDSSSLTTVIRGAVR